MSQSQQRIQTWANGIERAAQGPRSALYGLMHINPFTALAGSMGLFTTAIAGATLKFASFLNEIKKTADGLNISTDAYQRFDFAATHAGVSMAEVQSYLGRLAIKLDEARTGSKDAVAIFDKLGLSISDLSKKSPDEVFNNLIIRLGQLKKEGKDTAKIIQELFGRRAVPAIGKLIASDFVDLQGSVDVTDKTAFERAENLQREWESVKKTMVNLLATIADSTNIFKHLNNELEIFRAFVRTITGEKPVPLENQTRDRWREDVESAYASVLMSDERFGLDKQFSKQKELQEKLDIIQNRELPKAEMSGNPAAVDKVIKKAEKLQNELDKVNSKIEKIIGDILNTLTNQINVDPHLRQVFGDADIQKAIKEMLVKNLKFDDEQISKIFDKRIAEPPKSIPTIEQDNTQYIYQKLNTEHEKYYDKLELENKLKLESIKLTNDNIATIEYEIQTLHKLNELRKAGVNISEAEFRKRLNEAENNKKPETEMDKWFVNARKDIDTSVNFKLEEDRLKRLKKELKLRDALTKELQNEQATLRFNSKERATYEASVKAVKAGLNTEQTDQYSDYAKTKADLSWLKGLNVEGFRENIYTNDLARRGGFASSVTTWQKSSNDKVLEWLKMINDTEQRRNVQLNNLLDVLRD